MKLSNKVTKTRDLQNCFNDEFSCTFAVRTVLNKIAI